MMSGLARTHGASFVSGSRGRARCFRERATESETATAHSTARLLVQAEVFPSGLRDGDQSGEIRSRAVPFWGPFEDAVFFELGEVFILKNSPEASTDRRWDLIGTGTALARGKQRRQFCERQRSIGLCHCDGGRQPALVP